MAQLKAPSLLATASLAPWPSEAAAAAAAAAAAFEVTQCSFNGDRHSPWVEGRKLVGGAGREYMKERLEK